MAEENSVFLVIRQIQQRFPSIQYCYGYTVPLLPDGRFLCAATSSLIAT